MQGQQVLSQSLVDQGLEHCFGIVGVPILELGAQIQTDGIKYYGFRNEQAASYAAQAVGYLTGKPAINLCVSGPGMIHSLAGIANAWSNCWPMIVIAGASDKGQDGKGAFQECDQITLAKQYCKYSYRVTDISTIPFHVEKAVRYSLQGRPGPVYLEFPGDILTGSIAKEEVKQVPKFTQIAQACTTPQILEEAISTLKSAQKPLVIVGKGAAYAKIEKEVTQFIDQTGIPFLPTPMGRGVVPDSHQLNTGSARSTALGQADVILLLGARLNWMLHFGEPPRFQKNVKIIQVDICPEEFDTNIKAAVNIFGDLKSVITQLLQRCQSEQKNFLHRNQWLEVLNAKIAKNKIAIETFLSAKQQYMNYYQALTTIHSYFPKDFIYVGEGGNTMDIGRTIIQHQQPRTKLDAGTYGTMGIGLPFALAAQAAFPNRPVIGIYGDSAFGFSAMEIETAARYNMPLIIFVINNNGIFFGHDEMPESNRETELAPTSLGVQTRYEKMADAFGGKGYFVDNQQSLQQVCTEVFRELKGIKIINVVVDPYGTRKAQEHEWLTRGKSKL